MNAVKRISIVFFLTVMAMAAQAAVSFTAQAPHQVVEGNKFNIAFVLRNAEGQSFSPPEISWARKLYGPALSTSYSSSWVNGKSSSSSSQEYTMIYKAEKPGKYTVGPASIVVNGNRMTTKAITVEVVAGDKNANSGYPSGGQQAPQQRRNNQVHFDDPLTQDASRGVGANDLFVRIEMSKPRVYEQQAVVCTIKLYTKYQISQFITNKQPSFDGFLIEEINMQPSLNNEEVLNGQPYRVAVLKKCILYPQQSGKLTISSGNYDVNVVQYENYRTLFGTLSQPVERKMQVNSNQAVVNILPLPEPRPATFTGAVGKFTVKAALNNNDLKTFKASVFNYTIEGVGNIKYIKAPTIQFPKEFDVYDPKTNAQTASTGNDLHGTVKIDYTFIPQYAGDFKIPASVFTYFDPETGKYVDIDVPGCDLKVAKGKGSQSNHYRMQNMDIRHIKQGDLDISKSHSYMVDGFAYWLWYIIPALVLASLMVYYRKQLKQRADAGFMRTKRANKVAQRRLKKARAFMQAGNRTGFYAESLNAMWGYLSDKLGIPVSELSKENIEAELEAYGVGEQLRAATLSLLDRCEFAQYAPEITGDDMSKVMDEAANLIGDLENVKEVKL